jgi:hypothetical protein
MRDAGERVLKMSEIPFRHLWTTPVVNYYQWLLSKLSNCYGVPTGLTVSWKIQKCQKQKIYFYQDLEHLNMRSTGFLRNAGLVISGSVCNLLKYNFFQLKCWISVDYQLKPHLLDLHGDWIQPCTHDSIDSQHYLSQLFSTGVPPRNHLGVIQESL